MKALQSVFVLMSLGLLAGCATTGSNAARGVEVGAPKVAEGGGKAGKGEEAPGQPQINTHAKMAFDDANKAYEAQKKKGGQVDYEGLKRKYQTASDADPNLAEAEYDMGVVAEQQGKKDEAIHYYQEALRRKPTLKEAAENLAVISQNEGNVAQAVKVYENILENYPDDASSRARLAAIYREQHDTERALDLAKQALVRDPKSVPAYKVMLLCYLDENKLSMAKLIALRTIKLAENDPELYHAMGLILTKEQQPDKALLQFKKALEVRPDYLPSHVLLAKIALEKENYPEAEQHLRRMLQADPKNCALHLDLGVVYKGMGEYDKAMQEYDVTEKCGDVPGVHFNRCIILLKAKDAPQPAIDECKKYIASASPPSGHAVFTVLNEAQARIEKIQKDKEAEEQAKKMEEEMKAKELQEKQNAAKSGGTAPAAGAPGEPKPAKAGPGASKPEAKPASGKAAPPPPPESKPAPAPETPPAAAAKPPPPPPPEAKPAAKPPPSDEPTDEPKDLQ